jgi:S-adenosylmethionine:tRNA ribosyltransferase-isomerase
MHDIEEYTYDLPGELIAQEPAPERTDSRLLFLDRDEGDFSDHRFSDLSSLLDPGTLLVVNDTQVVPARLFGRKESGGQVEVLVLDHVKNGTPGPAARRCLLKASKRPKPGSRLLFDEGLSGTVENWEEDGIVRIAFSGPESIDALLSKIGGMPLPPYIRRARRDPRAEMDRTRYQTVFSRWKGAVAAPTAGLHFSEALIKRLEEAGVSLVSLTLHVGHGTFRPVRTRDIRAHAVGAEAYRIDAETATSVNRAREQGRKVIAVGTTVVRTLETVAAKNGSMAPGEGWTDLTILPGHRFRAVDGMITNFHLPASSLFLLVSAFAGLDRIKRSYAHAVQERYRFYSYGDAMLICQGRMNKVEG